MSGPPEAAAAGAAPPESAAEGSGLPASAVETPGTSTFVDVGDATLHAVVAGPTDGEPVVVLHGFPECWYAWAEYIEPLAEAGYRVIVPDQRGYNLSDKPRAVRAYRPDALAGDVTGLLDALDREDAHLVGHDWGGIVAWWVGIHAADRVRTLSILNVPHPATFRRALLTDPRQLLRSWYGVCFQLPWLPEAIARARNWRAVVATLDRTSRSGTFDETDFDRYRRAWGVDSAYRSMVHWYRAAVRTNARPERRGVEPPTLLLWGEDDRFLRRSLAAESLEHCEDGRLGRVENATHWLHHERPDAVRAALTGQFAAGSEE